MLKILNDLSPFFEDCYRRINVREYARIRKISPPTASKLLEHYRKEGMLKREEDRQFLYYFADKGSSVFSDLSRIYWNEHLGELSKGLSIKFLSPVIILFGSLSKAEAKKDSDVDIAVFAPSEKKINLKEFEKKLKRNVQLFMFKGREYVKNKELLNNILNGYILEGKW